MYTSSAQIIYGETKNAGAGFNGAQIVRHMRFPNIYKIQIQTYMSGLFST